MAELPALTGKQVVAAFEALGFRLDRIRGSHHVLKKPGHRYLLTVPIHGSKTLGDGLLRRLIRDAGLTVDEFLAAL